MVAQQLTNCAVNFARPGFVDDSEIVYYLTVLRSKNSSVALRYEDVDNQLLDMGVSSAGAGTAADAYVRRPGSACGQLTKRALEGNPVARRQLIAGERNACTALWRK